MPGVLAWLSKCPAVSAYCVLPLTLHCRSTREHLLGKAHSEKWRCLRVIPPTTPTTHTHKNENTSVNSHEKKEYSSNFNYMLYTTSAGESELLLATSVLLSRPI